MIDPAAAKAFLDLPRLALVGAVGDPKKFATAIYRELKARGKDVVAVNRVDPIPGDVDGVIVMVQPERAADVIDACAARGVRHVWLFQGIGGTSVDAAALERGRHHGMDVIPGACPLMFLEPVGWFHRLHRGVRRARGDLLEAS